MSVLLITLLMASMPYAKAVTQISNPILFVTQVPIPADFTTITALFGNHKAGMQDVGRGGDLWIRYADGTTRNLTAAAGLGGSGLLTGTKAIAVRDPAVHWDGAKAVFSMVIGAPTQRYQLTTHYWQLYEVTGFLNPTGPITITQVSNQPANFNNVSPFYGTDDRIIFTSDRPRNGAAHLYPQLDEYELAPVVTGLWSLDPTTGDLFMVTHSPSGDFTPIVDSYGRLVFTRWDHMQRDQQADGDTPGSNCYSAGASYGTFNYSDESASATYNLNVRTEVWPEPRACRNDLLTGTGLYGHSFNHFFPWQVNEDGTELETLNHIGRHELHSYVAGSRTDDSNIVEYYGQYARYNPNSLNNLLQIKEDPLSPGRYYGIDAPEFGTHAAGQVISLTATLTQSSDTIAVSYVTHRATSGACDANCANHSGLYREPLPMLDGSIVVVHTAETRQDQNIGTAANPLSRYDFRLKTITKSGAYWTPNMTLTAGISKTISYWDPDTLVTYSGLLWELNPVEVRARPRPTRLTPTLPAPEQQVFTDKSVSVTAFQTYLRDNNLALVVSRNVTTRDDQDKQQPFNLRVVGGAQTITSTGKIYDLKFIQFFQADQLRGWTGCCSATPRPGRRVLGQAMHDPAAIANNPPTTGPQGSTLLGMDGSQASIVPARRAMAWQLTDANGVGVVRERYWLTFQPGEIRICTSCHGLNDKDQAGQTKPTNSPQALGALLDYWKTLQNLTPRVYLPLVVR
jgi:hypothetical protein